MKIDIVIVAFERIDRRRSNGVVETLSVRVGEDN
jgi:hypothetical protein